MTGLLCVLLAVATVAMVAVTVRMDRWLRDHGRLFDLMARHEMGRASREFPRSEDECVRRCAEEIGGALSRFGVNSQIARTLGLDADAWDGAPVVEDVYFKDDEGGGPDGDV